MPSENGESGVFADRTVLSPTASPPSFDHRETEFDRVRTALSPALSGTGPATALLAGPPAQGKRTTVRALCDSLADRGTTELVTVECTGTTTAYELAISLTNAVLDEEVLASSGYTRETAFRRFRNAVRDADATPIVRLDGVDRLDTTEVTRLLAGLFDYGTVTCGLAAVADDRQVRNQWPPAVRDRFPVEVSFAPYDEATRRAILTDRARVAFVDGVCTDAAIDRCLAVAAADDAPLRTALELLARAGEEAVAAGDHSLTATHVDAADRALEHERLATAIDELSAHERRTLAAVLAVDDRGRFTTVYEAYERQCDRDGVDPNRERSVHNYLDTLASAGLIESEEDLSREGGRFLRYRTRADEQTLRAAFEAVTETTDGE